MSPVTLWYNLITDKSEILLIVLEKLQSKSFFVDSFLYSCFFEDTVKVFINIVYIYLLD